jgi:ParB family transcriptional regulator, chromosome partitioning protein
MSDEPVIRISVNPPDESGGEDSGKEKPRAKEKPRRLGRGLGALLGETRSEAPIAAAAAATTARGGVSEVGEGLAMLPVAAIDPHPNQPRKHFDEESLEELAASIARSGVIQPVIVRRDRSRYQLVAGERRWRAAQKAQVHEIPAIIRDLDDRDVMALALIENLQREDLNPIEEARAFQHLADSEGLTQAEIAGLVDKSRSHVANLMRLLALPADVVAMVEEGSLSMGHARALIGCDDALAIAREVAGKQLSVREVERLVRRKAKGEGEDRDSETRARRPTQANADILAVQAHLEEFLGLPVRISADTDPRSGAVTIRYATLDQLDLICQRLTGGEI